MDRVSALKALFGDNANTTASAEAVLALGSDPRPTPEEARQLGQLGQEGNRILNKACAFAERPEFESEDMEGGIAQAILIDYAADLSRVESTPQERQVAQTPLLAIMDPEPAPESKPHPDFITIPQELTPAKVDLNHPPLDIEGNKDMARWNRKRSQSDSDQDDPVQKKVVAQLAQPIEGHKDDRRKQDEVKVKPPPPPPKPPETRESDCLITPQGHAIIVTRKWYISRTATESYYRRIRDGQVVGATPEALHAGMEARRVVASWEQNQKDILSSQTSSGTDKSYATYFLKLLDALKRNHLTQEHYRELFVDGKGPHSPHGKQ